jgi:hypothetical protein
MPPNDDVERPRASSAAERQKSIVSMTEFEGMDEYTALQKYILFYRDARTNPHAEKATKKKAWWQFWKSGSPTAAEPIEDDGAVPDERTYSIFLHPARLFCSRITSPLRNASECSLCFARARIRWLQKALSVLKLSQPNASLRCSRRGANQGRPTHLQQRPHQTIVRRAACEMSIAILQTIVANIHRSHQHPASHRSHHQRRRHSSQALWLQRDLV